MRMLLLLLVALLITSHSLAPSVMVIAQPVSLISSSPESPPNFSFSSPYSSVALSTLQAPNYSRGEAANSNKNESVASSLSSSPQKTEKMRRRSSSASGKHKEWASKVNRTEDDATPSQTAAAGKHNRYGKYGRYRKGRTMKREDEKHERDGGVDDAIAASPTGGGGNLLTVLGVILGFALVLVLALSWVNRTFICHRRTPRILQLNGTPTHCVTPNVVISRANGNGGIGNGNANANDISVTSSPIASYNNYYYHYKRHYDNFDSHKLSHPQQLKNTSSHHFDIIIDDTDDIITNEHNNKASSKKLIHSAAAAVASDVDDDEATTESLAVKSEREAKKSGSGKNGDNLEATDTVTRCSSASSAASSSSTRSSRDGDVTPQSPPFSASALRSTSASQEILEQREVRV